MSVEASLRTLAIQNPNIYVVALFACCRQIFNPQKDTGFCAIEPKDPRYYLARPEEEEKEELDPEEAAAAAKFQEIQKKLDEHGLAMKGRGNPFEPSKLMSNVCFAWGCQPSKLVNVDTKMIWSFFGTLRDKYSRKTLAVEFPEAFDSMIANAGDE